MFRKSSAILFLGMLCLCFALLSQHSVQAKMRNTVLPPRFWDKECLTCDQSILPGFEVSLDIDQQGYPHLVADVTSSITNTYTIMNFYEDDLGWHSQIIDDSIYGGFSLLLELDSNDYEHVLYDESELSIKYAYRDQIGWHVQNIFGADEFGDTGAQMIHVTSLVLDTNNYPHATVEAIINQGTVLVYYIYLSDTGWQKEEVGEGATGAIAFDSLGNPHFAYVHEIFDGAVLIDSILYHAYRDNLGWHPEEVAHLVGPRVAIALDGADYPHIASGSYYTPLEYHHKDESGWEREVLGGSIAQNPIILLNSQGNPFIGFNECCGHITYAFWTQSGWDLGQIENPYFYASIGMAMDASEEIYFAFRETGTLDVIFVSPYEGPIYTFHLPVITR